MTQYELELDLIDVKTTFLHGDLDEEIFMSQPTGFKTARKENMVCKLRKSAKTTAKVVVQAFQ